MIGAKGGRGMAKLVYSMLMSLDGFVADVGGAFGWAAPDDAELQAHLLAGSAGIGTYLFGRRMYQVMSYWENAGGAPGQSWFEKDWARHWAGTDKIVYSQSLAASITARTELRRAFDPGEVAALKARAAADIAIAGPGIAAHAMAAGLVDEVRAYLCPVMVGAGTRFFPQGVSCTLDLQEVKRFPSGAVFMRHAVRDGA